MRAHQLSCRVTTTGIGGDELHGVLVSVGIRHSEHLTMAAGVRFAHYR